MNNRPHIPGFVLRGKRYQLAVTLEREDALDIRAEADERGVHLTRVVEDRVRAGRKVKS